MKYTVGEWKTRDGFKAIVAAENEEAFSDVQLIGWIEGFAKSWNKSGRRDRLSETPDDLISPWVDPVPWDWSTTPPWVNWIARTVHGSWMMFRNEPEPADGIWLFENGAWIIPPDYSPEWNGDWMKSKTMRPGFEGGSK